MSRLRRCAVLVGAALWSLAGCSVPPSDITAAPSPIVLDGEFGEWEHAPVILDDPVDAEPGSEIELRKLWGADDPAWLFVSLDVGRSVNLQSHLGTVHLLIDADANPGTGATAFGMEGVDFSLDMSRMDSPQRSGRGAGSALRAVDETGLAAYRSSYDLGVVAAPVWASTRFEIRISRGGAPDGFGLMAGEVRIKVVFDVDEVVLDETEVGSYTFTNALGPDPFSASFEPLNRDSTAVRIAVWNVAEDRFREPVDHAALLAAVQPDVIMLDEVYRDVTPQSLEAFFRLPPLAALGDWTFVLGRSGGRQKTVVATRGLAIRQAESMVRVEYPPGAIEALRGVSPDGFQRTLDLEEERHLSATGAWIDIQGTEVLFIPIDLQSGGYAGGPRDLLRSLQARTIRSSALAEIDASDTRAPIVMGGDFNLVGSFDPMVLASEGMDTDGSALTAATLSRLGEGTHSTWRNPQAGLFGPGRLDFTLFSDTALEQVGGFIFATEDLTDAQLSQLGLTRDQSSRPSDHLIVVTDLRIR